MVRPPSAHPLRTYRTSSSVRRLSEPRTHGSASKTCRGPRDHPTQQRLWHDIVYTKVEHLTQHGQHDRQIYRMTCNRSSLYGYSMPRPQSLM